MLCVCVCTLWIGRKRLHSSLYSCCYTISPTSFFLNRRCVLFCFFFIFFFRVTSTYKDIDSFNQRNDAADIVIMRSADSLFIITLSFTTSSHSLHHFDSSTLLSLTYSSDSSPCLTGGDQPPWVRRYDVSSYIFCFCCYFLKNGRANNPNSAPEITRASPHFSIDNSIVFFFVFFRVILRL